MARDRRTSTADKMLTAIDLHETGVRLMRQNLRRQFPSESTRQIDARLQRWLIARGEHASGDLIAAPRTRRRPGR